jgi:peptide/nickel transport system substrate-binding protein
MYMSGYIMGIDPSTFATLFASDSPDNYSHVADPSLDGLFSKGAVETDTAKRKALYEQTQQWLAADASYIPLIENKRILVVTSSLSGIDKAALVPVYTFEDSSKLFFR